MKRADGQRLLGLLADHAERTEGRPRSEDLDTALAQSEAAAAINALVNEARQLTLKQIELGAYHLAAASEVFSEVATQTAELVADIRKQTKEVRCLSR